MLIVALSLPRLCANTAFFGLHRSIKLLELFAWFELGRQRNWHIPTEPRFCDGDLRL